MKKTITVITVICIISIICSISVFAGNESSSVSGTLSTTESFDVSIGDKLFSSDKVVIKQQKGNTRQSWWGITKYIGVYGHFYVSVYDRNTSSYIVKDDRWDDETYTISGAKLKKNHSYIITVRGDKNEYVLDDYSSFPFVFREWISEPSWNVSKVGDNVAFCSQLPAKDNSEETNDNYNSNSKIIRGDVNGDGKVSITDLSNLRNYLSGGSGTVEAGADVNGDGKISITDLSKLREMLAQ